MRHFLDCEFHEHDHGIELISLGVVSANGRELYVESLDYDRAKADQWLQQNVLPHLGPVERCRTKRDIGRLLASHVGDDPEPKFWGWYCDYDWVVICQLFGRMIDLPKSFPKFCRDLRQHIEVLGFPRNLLPPDPKDEHHALADARWIRDAFNVVARSGEARLQRALRRGHAAVAVVAVNEQDGYRTLSAGSGNGSLRLARALGSGMDRAGFHASAPKDWDLDFDGA